MAAIILRLFLFTLPFLIFFLVMRMLKRKAAGEEGDPELEKKIGQWSIGGIIVLLVGIIFILVTGETNTNKTYVPPQEVDGEIVPGHFKEDED